LQSIRFVEFYHRHPFLPMNLMYSAPDFGDL
jgi:hypothetical protein